MARNGSGTYSLPQAAFVSGTVISSSAVNSDLSDIAAALTQSVSKDGQTAMTGNLPMGGNKLTGLASGVDPTDSITLGQVVAGALNYAAAGGTADVITIAPSPGITAYAIGQVFRVKMGAGANTTNVTLNVNSIGAGAVTWPNGAALVAGNIPASAMFEVIVQATTPVFHLQTVAVPPFSAAGGTLTGTLTMSGAPINEAHGADIASASTINLTTATGNLVDVTGTTTITAITLGDGMERTVRFTGALILTNGASLVLPGGANITTTAGDYAVFRGYAAGVVRCVTYSKLSGAPILMSPITNSLSGDVACNNTANYFAGPVVAQGSVGTWYVSGTVTVQDSAGAANFLAKLWDGTTVIDSAICTTSAANAFLNISLSGYIASPAGNLRIDVRDTTATTGAIIFSSSGNGKDSTVTAIRIA